VPFRPRQFLRIRHKVYGYERQRREIETAPLLSRYGKKHRESKKERWSLCWFSNMSSIRRRITWLEF
jgi:hypothetical protein